MPHDAEFFPCCSAANDSFNTFDLRKTIILSKTCCICLAGLARFGEHSPVDETCSRWQSRLRFGLMCFAPDTAALFKETVVDHLFSCPIHRATAWVDWAFQTFYLKQNNIARSVFTIHRKVLSFGEQKLEKYDGTWPVSAVSVMRLPISCNSSVRGKN